MKHTPHLLLLCTVATLMVCVATPWSLAHADTLTADQVLKVLKTVDDRQRNNGDYTAQVIIDQREKDKNDLVYDATVYRRDERDRLMILFQRPKTERGKGYLRIDHNLWFYDPRVGKWERRTERERIGGTGSNRQDFDESRLAEEFVGTHTGDVKLGRYTAHKLILKAKPGVDVAYPTVKMWVDVETYNTLKVQDIAASGKLMRTSYYPKWRKLYSKSKGADVWFPKEIRIFDEVEKSNRTIIVIRRPNLDSLPTNIFTKAWLESKSR
jgi:hypothetical protein